jgi:hypothetical protein
MNIDSYSFGKMVIEGKIYQSDLIIYPEKVDPSWWRKEGHKVQLEDLTAILAVSPEVLIIGTGYMGLMKVPDELRKELLKRNIELYVEKSSRAVEIFNSINTKRKTVAAFHLTC